MGRWVLWGWVALAIVVVGLVLGFVLYTRIVIGIGLQDQHALLHLPEALIVQTRAEEEAAITLRGRVEVDVPFKHEALPLPLKGTYKANLALDTMVPLRMNIEYEDVIPIETTVAIKGDTKLISKWLPRMPIEGELPLKLDVPVSLKVPVDTRIRFVYDGPVQVGFDQTIYPPVDTTLHTAIDLDKEVSAPITNVFEARVIPNNRELPIILTDTRLTLPLQDLKVSPMASRVQEK
ncbi:MAG: hypothetical protein P1U59_05855 [Alcanivorax sp.]|jgi:hypothetical protein|uniref:hypothetical protein n=1 Tax=Alcanivorax sp. TaxID=1872427 RepID=UPI001990006C|nr:hypothetical protein [Alcanivorax sp.]MBD3645810.1 hypothetical protein [Alcanivorax sp.]MDF1724025.1 hypothetical protein [Alcanivorax sp.]